MFEAGSLQSLEDRHRKLSVRSSSLKSSLGLKATMKEAAEKRKSRLDSAVAELAERETEEAELAVVVVME